MVKQAVADKRAPRLPESETDQAAAVEQVAAFQLEAEEVDNQTEPVVASSFEEQNWLHEEEEAASFEAPLLEHLAAEGPE